MDAQSPFPARAWQDFLTEELERDVTVQFGRARRQVLWAQEQRGCLVVRMSSIFGHAPADVRTATATWLRSGRRAKRACALLDAWIEDSRHLHPPRRKTTLDTSGRAYDLLELAADVYRCDLDEELLPTERRPQLTWGARRRRKAYRSLLLGTYEAEEGLVRIHPVLDQPVVPRFFVRFVVFHELLHAAVDPPERKRRERVHGPVFRRLEQAQRDHARAMAWQHANLNALIVSARTGRDLKPKRRPLGRAVRFVQGLLFD